jgi:hypothetical protein
VSTEDVFTVCLLSDVVSRGTTVRTGDK